MQQSQMGDAETSSMEMAGKTAKIAGSILASKVFAFIVTGIAFIVIARILGPSQYGIYTLATATAGFFGAFGDFGFSTSIVKFVSEHIAKKQYEQARKIVINSYAIAITEGVIFTIIAVALAGIVAQLVFHNASYTTILQVAALSIIISIVWNISYSILVALGRSKIITYAMLLQAGVQAAVSVALAVLGFGAFAPLIGYMSGFVTGFIYATAVAMPILKVGIGHIRNISTKEWRGLLTFTLPIGLSGTVIGLVSNFSFIFLGIFAASVVIGNIGVTSKLFNMFDVVLGSIGISLLPFFSTALAKGRARKKVGAYYNYSIYFALLLLAPAVFYIIVLAQPFSFTVFSGYYAFTPIYLPLMCIGVLLAMVNLYTVNLLVSAGKVRKILKYGMIASLMQLVLIFALVPFFGGLGLIVVNFVLTPLITAVLFVRRAQETLSTKLSYARFAKVLVAGVVSALFILPLYYFLYNYSIPLLIMAAIEQILLYPALLSLFKGIDKKTLELLRKVVKDVPGARDVMRLLTGYTSIFLR